MNNSLQKAAVSKGLIVTLVVLVVAAGVFWGVKSRSKSSALKEATSARSFTVTCSECGVLHNIVPASDVAKMNDEAQNGKLKCPKCGKFTAVWGMPKGAPGGGDTDSEAP
jgi:ribosomal protein S27E